jgi:hypothetical protein
MLTRLPIETKRPRRTHIFARDSNDRYVEPEWCSRRLFEEETFRGGIHDPAAGTGRILASARAAGFEVSGADISPLSSDVRTIDFLKDQTKRDNIICNSPYGVMREFALHALELAERKVAFLSPLARLNAAHWLQQTPLRRVWLLSPRPSIPPHSYLLAGKKPEGGRVDFCWLVWQRGFSGQPALHWLRRESNR